MQENITKWFKRIFSVNTLALFVSICAAYFAYLQYQQSMPGKLDIYIKKDYKNYKLDNIKLLYLITEDYDYISDLPKIEFVNSGKNVIPNLKVELIIRGSNCLISDKFEIIKEDEDNYTTELVYKNSCLEGKSSLPFPIEEISEIVTTKYGIGILDLEYHIYYDGLKSPIYFEYTILFNDIADEDFLRSSYQHMFLQTVLVGGEYDVGNENVGVIYEDTLMWSPKNIQSFNLSDGERRENIFDIGESIILNDEDEDNDGDNILIKLKNFIFNIF